MVPTTDDIDRIAKIADPVLRNLQITQCYHEIAGAMDAWTGEAANWCSFATWASKQAGQSIRQEDLIRTFEDRFRNSPEILAAVQGVIDCVGTSRSPIMHSETADRVPGRGAGSGSEPPARTSALPPGPAAHAGEGSASLGMRWIAPADIGQVWQRLEPARMIARVSDAIARGNKKVFEEIGREFARFLAAFAGDTAFDPEKTARFCAGLREGDPPVGQKLLRESFTAYGAARFQPDPDVRNELVLFANLLAGFHEQTRLQPEIAEALDASFGGAEELKRSLLMLLLPGFWIRARYRLGRVLGRKLALDQALDRLVMEARRQLRQVITHHLMTLHLPDEILRLGADLRGEFPAMLRQIAHAKLRDLLARIDPTPDSLTGSGAVDWANFDDRMHFITDFFRCYHERAHRFGPPFTPEQVAELKAGRRPAGRL